MASTLFTQNIIACVWLLENLFKLHPGIAGSRVNFPRREVEITYAPERVALSEVAALLAGIRAGHRGR